MPEQFGSFVARLAAGTMRVIDVIVAAEAVNDNVRFSQDLYDLWLARHPENPAAYAVHFNNGVLRGKSNDLHGAIASFQQAIAQRPDFFPPYINLGAALERSGDRLAAVLRWLQVVNHASSGTPENIGYASIALTQVGRVFEAARDHATAETALRRSLEIDPAQTEVIQHWISLRQAQCKWPVLQPFGEIQKPDLMAAISPLSLAALFDDPMFQLARAHHYHRRDRATLGATVTVGQWVPTHDRARRLRIGYLSPDLREHAIGFLTGEIFGLHDRSKFSVHAYYTGPDLPDPQQARIRSGVDRWRDLGHASDTAAATMIVADDIDILVDLGGYTKDTRNKLLALRPAPLIVNWLGFPGSLGSTDHHYIIADATIVPPDGESFFSEAVCRLPCYQPNAAHRAVAPPPTREEVGLPADAFVYCCFNGAQKISSATFATWLDVLRQVPASVLWLLSADDTTDARLRELAGEQGVDPGRLIFAGRKANPAHMARYLLADLFLDTAPYGAHTTASDALWMGVPVITVAGRSFAARVCASLLNAVGLPELVVPTAAAYVATAAALANDRQGLGAMKAKLLAARHRSILFDPAALVSKLETLYLDMWQAFIADRLPTPRLDDLDRYFATGCALDRENTGLGQPSGFAPALHG